MYHNFNFLFDYKDTQMKNHNRKNLFKTTLLKIPLKMIKCVINERYLRIY